MSDFIELDVTSEEFRIYELPSGNRHRVDYPIKVLIKKGSGSHRVIDRDGVTHYIPSFDAIVWKADPPVTY